MEVDGRCVKSLHPAPLIAVAHVVFSETGGESGILGGIIEQTAVRRGLAGVLAEQVGFVAQFTPPRIVAVYICGIVVDVDGTADGIKEPAEADQIAHRLPDRRGQQVDESLGGLPQVNCAVSGRQMLGFRHPGQCGGVARRGCGRTRESGGGQTGEHGARQPG